MTPWEGFSVGVVAVSVLVPWLTGITWWHGRTTDKLILQSHTDTRALARDMHADTQALIRDIHAETQRTLERMDQRADERPRQMTEAIQVLKR